MPDKPPPPRTHQTATAPHRQHPVLPAAHSTKSQPPYVYLNQFPSSWYFVSSHSVSSVHRASPSVATATAKSAAAPPPSPDRYTPFPPPFPIPATPTLDDARTPRIQSST